MYCVTLHHRGLSVAGELYAAGSLRGSVRLRAQFNHGSGNALRLRRQPITSLAFSPDGGTCERGLGDVSKNTRNDAEMLAAGTESGTCRVFHPASRQLLFQLPPLHTAIYGLVFVESRESLCMWHAARGFTHACSTLPHRQHRGALAQLGTPNRPNGPRPAHVTGGGHENAEVCQQAHCRG